MSPSDGNKDTNLGNLLTHLNIADLALITSIRVGDIYVRPKEIQQHLGRYANRLVSYTGVEEYPFQHFGTATGILYRGRYFIVSTNHQRRRSSTGEIGIFSNSGEMVVTPSKIWTVDYSNESDRELKHDFAVYEYSPDLYESPTLASQFFRVEGRVDNIAEVGKMALNFAYPTRIQNIDYDEEQVNLTVVSSFVKFIEKSTSDSVVLFETTAENRFFEDGTSGSPIFEIIQAHGEFMVQWVGLVVLGGKESTIGRAIDANSLLDHIDDHVFGDKP